MGLIHHWSHPTTPAGVGWDIVQTNVVRLSTEKGFSARAALGEAEVIRVIVDDLTGTRDYKTLHRWYLVEDETPGDQLVWNGYINDQWIDNGEEGDLVYPTGVGRRWELEIVQENTLLGFRVIQGAEDAAHGLRPAESPGERLDWILGSDFLSTVLDHGLIDWTALNAMPDMDETRYHGQTAADVLRDISLKTGFNHYVRYRDASSDIELAFYNPNTSELDSSTLRVTNVEADVDFATTWPPFFAGYRLHRKGDRVAAGVLVQGQGVNSYGYDLSTSYEFGFRDMVVQDANSKTQGGVDRLRNRLLAQHNSQDERITGLRIQLPAANLNDVKHGQRIEAKFAHLPGWEDWRWARVVSKAFSRPENDTQALYDVDLELSPQSPVVTPQAILYRAQSDGLGVGSPDPIAWVTRGDDGALIDEPYLETIGPITFIPGSTPGPAPHGNWLGMQFDGPGEIEVEARFEVFGAGFFGQTFAVNLLIDGAVAGTYSCVLGVDCDGSDKTILNVADTFTVVPGNQLTAVHTTGGDYIDKFQLEVVGGTLQLP